MFNELLKKDTYNEQDIAFVSKNMANAPKELLVKLGFISEEPKKKVETEEEVAPKKTKGTK
jgi:hypothetical protein